MDATRPESPPPACQVQNTVASRKTPQIREGEVPADQSGGRAGRQMYGEEGVHYMNEWWKNYGFWREGAKIYGVCAECGKIVRINKPILGAIHVCR